MPDQRTDDERFVPARNPAQFGEFADIDDHLRRNEPQIHRGDQALPARKHPRLLPIQSKQFQRWRRWSRVRRRKPRLSFRQAPPRLLLFCF